MRKVVVTEFVSLDGVMEEPAWTVPYWNDDIAKFKGDEQDTSDALLLGRVTYKGFAAAWPDSPDEGAEYMNNVRKYVVSTTLEKAAWSNSVLINDDIIAELTKLKRQDEGHSGLRQRHTGADAHAAPEIPHPQKYHSEKYGDSLRR